MKSLPSPGRGPAQSQSRSQSRRRTNRSKEKRGKTQKPGNAELLRLVTFPDLGLSNGIRVFSWNVIDL